eukprot:598713-Lingulodinium_polyedra.AAC.1
MFSSCSWPCALSGAGAGRLARGPPSAPSARLMPSERVGAGRWQLASISLPGASCEGTGAVGAAGFDSTPDP